METIGGKVSLLKFESITQCKIGSQAHTIGIISLF